MRPRVARSRRWTPSSARTGIGTRWSSSAVSSSARTVGNELADPTRAFRLRPLVTHILRTPVGARRTDPVSRPHGLPALAVVRRVPPPPFRPDGLAGRVPSWRGAGRIPGGTRVAPSRGRQVRGERLAAASLRCDATNASSVQHSEDARRKYVVGEEVSPRHRMPKICRLRVGRAQNCGGGTRADRREARPMGWKARLNDRNSVSRGQRRAWYMPCKLREGSRIA